MAEYSANAVQTVNPGESVIFTNTAVPCSRGVIRHRDDTGSFLIAAGAVPRRRCGCPVYNSYTPVLVEFGANIAIPTGGTVGAISLAVEVDGTTVPSSTMIATPAAVEEYSNTMIATPAAVEEYSNVAVAVSVPVWSGCCETLSIRNTSDQPILVQNANVILTRSNQSVVASC